jgi:glycosyltransferase involved in cell wall biosynthesis
MKILIATPMMPPTAGGPATHAKRLYDYFESVDVSKDSEFLADLFNFEIYKIYPSGIRHFLCFIHFLFIFRKYDMVLALDGFTVAMPAVLAGIIMRKKVILRVGGDFIYENYLYTKEVTFEDFYKNFNTNKKQMSPGLKIKYLCQKFVLENCYTIVFNTNWQAEIYKKHYELPEEIYIVTNPFEKIDKNSLENIKIENQIYDNLNDKYIFTSITRDIPYKNLKRLNNVFKKINNENINHKVILDTKQGSHSDCLSRISKSRGYVCASISDISPNQVFEALSLGIPVICTKYIGIKDVLNESGAVRFINPFDEEDVKQAVIEFCDDEKYVKYKRAAENFIHEKTWQEMYEEYEIIFREVM